MVKEELSYDELREQFDYVYTEYLKLESVNDDALRAEEIGWKNIDQTFQRDGQGIELDKLKGLAELIDNMIASNALIGRGYDLWYSYTFGKGTTFYDVKSARVQKAIESENNQSALFGENGWRRYLKQLYTGGNAFILWNGSKTDPTFDIIPLYQIAGFVTDPELPDKIMYVKRSWTYSNTIDDGLPQTREMWYRVTSYEEPLSRQTIKGVKVAKKQEMIVHQPGKLPGHLLAVPRTMSAIPWAMKYSIYLEDCYITNKSYSKFAWKLVGQSNQSAVDKAAAKVYSSGDQVGSLAQLGSGLDLVSLNRGTNHVDFNTGRALAAPCAASLGVSIVALLADPGQSGAYGTAQTLDVPTELFMLGLQNDYNVLIRHIGKLLGSPGMYAEFPTIDSDAPYRVVQSASIAYLNDLLTDEQARTLITEVMDITAESVGEYKTDKDLALGLIGPEATQRNQTAPKGSGEFSSGDNSARDGGEYD